MSPESKVKRELENKSGISIISLIDGLIEEAQNSRASDIHIDPREKDVRVRLRIDGVLKDAYSLPREIHSEVITRVKVLAGLRTDEHQAAQDGRFRTIFEGANPIDIRVSIAPAYYGENCVLRLLSEHAEKFTIDTMGFSSEDLTKIKNAIQKPYGMVLATGPTGSGKTTTLYTFLKSLHKPEISIITIEDPIEYSIEGVNQIQVNRKTELTFANGLRAILRQDPDIIMVGEIRDRETAGLAINTALTGHLVLSTLHTNDAATTLPRMLDLGLEPYLITATVNLVIAQRLVRKICSFCKEGREATDAALKELAKSFGVAPLTKGAMIYKGKGCEVCNNSGYRGRLGIFEVILVNDAIRQAMLERRSSSDIRKIARGEGMKTMVEDGFKKVLEGVTSIEEILRVVHE